MDEMSGKSKSSMASSTSTKSDVILRVFKDALSGIGEGKLKPINYA